VWDIIRAMVSSGTTVLLTTQYLDEADQLADGISVIDHGKLVAEGTPTQLKASVGAGSLLVRVMNPSDRARAREILQRTLGTEVREEADPVALFAAVEASTVVTAAMNALDEAGIALAQLSLGQPTLDEVFLALTGHPADTDAEEVAA
jgi:ABC-2 type transport system ATP-binding protein